MSKRLVIVANIFLLIIGLIDGGEGQTVSLGKPIANDLANKVESPNELTPRIIKRQVLDNDVRALKSLVRRFVHQKQEELIDGIVNVIKDIHSKQSPFWGQPQGPLAKRHWGEHDEVNNDDENSVQARFGVWGGASRWGSAGRWGNVWG